MISILINLGCISGSFWESSWHNLGISFTYFWHHFLGQKNVSHSDIPGGGVVPRMVLGPGAQVGGIKRRLKPPWILSTCDWRQENQI